MNRDSHSIALTCASLALALGFAGLAQAAGEADHAHMNHGHRPPAAAAHAGHAAPAPAAGAAVDHAAMGHGAPDQGAMDHGSMDHGAMGHAPAAPAQPQPPSSSRTPIPPLTDADRAAAFPPVHGHQVHDRQINWLASFEQLEYQDAEEGSVLSWDASGWIGGDIDRLWWRSEGERTNGMTEEAELQLLWGRAIGPWWELVGGLRQDFKPAPAQTWAAFGVQGMPLYGVELEATAFLGENGQSAARLEAEYDLLLTNRLILQPSAEVNLYGKNDEHRGIGSGLADTELGLRLRYEIRREFAPYVGIEWSRAHGRSADLLRDDGEDVSDTRLVAGIRFWF